MGWADKYGNLWVFGGQAYDCSGLANGIGLLNNMWLFRLYKS